MLCKVKGVVIRNAEYGDSDKLLTLLTHEMGKVVVCVKGGKSIKSKHMPSCELFAYSEFQLYEKQGRFWVRESYLCESFFSIRRALEPMYLGQYLCDVTCDYALHDMPDESLLRLLLNSLYLLTSDKKDRRIVKCVFELKSAAIEGFMPDINECSGCGCKSSDMFFDAIEGVVLCSECKSGINSSDSPFGIEQAAPVYILDSSILDAMRYILHSPIERSFSFVLPDEELSRLSVVCEAYLLHQMEHSFKTLDFYKMLQK